MYDIDTADSVATEPTRPVAGTPKFFSNIAQTIMPDWWCNMVQKELGTIVTTFGLTPDKTDDTQVMQAIKLAAQGADIAFVEITGHDTEALTGNGEVIYDLSAFQGIGLDTDNIREIQVYCQANGSGNVTRIVQAKLPGMTTYSDVFSGTAEGSENMPSSALIPIPINAGQTTLSLTSNRADATYTIVGARQKTYAF